MRGPATARPSAMPGHLRAAGLHNVDARERLRVDRRLEEALTHGADPLHLAFVFGTDEKTAIRYAQSARALRGEAAEQPSQ